jgi:valyl-tRNA synthetase
VFIAETEEKPSAYAEQEVIRRSRRGRWRSTIKREVFITRDEDVLDTWFSRRGQ